MIGKVLGSWAVSEKEQSNNTIDKEKNDFLEIHIDIHSKEKRK